MDLTAIIAWVKNNPEVTAAILIYIVVNVAPRKHPDEIQNPWLKFFWLLLDRLAVLTHDKLPGKLKLPLRASPLAPARTEDKST